MYRLVSVLFALLQICIGFVPEIFTHLQRNFLKNLLLQKLLDTKQYNQNKVGYIINQCSNQYYFIRNVA